MPIKMEDRFDFVDPDSRKRLLTLAMRYSIGEITLKELKGLLGYRPNSNAMPYPFLSAVLRYVFRERLKRK